MDEYQKGGLQVFCNTESVFSTYSYLFCILNKSLKVDKIS